MENITTGPIFLSNYEFSRFLNNQVNLYEHKFKIKFELWGIVRNLSFELTRFCCMLVFPLYEI
jgi:hypothetical protein